MKARLLLGPVVGYTNQSSTRIWVRAQGAVEKLCARINMNGATRQFAFTPTEFCSVGQRIYHTGVCVIEGLMPGREYEVRIVERGSVVGLTLGLARFRTMTHPRSSAAATIVSTSCSGGPLVSPGDNAWPKLREFVETNRPDYLLLMGDQVYTDSKDSPPNLWDDFLLHPGRERKAAFAEMYQLAWQRDSLRQTLAQVPVAMMWDDHEIRDGWGSRPGDTDALLDRYPKSKPIVDLFGGYYADAREAFWHFQRCHGPIGPFLAKSIEVPGWSQSPRFGEWSGRPLVSIPKIMARKATFEYWFDVGSTRVFMCDGRGARDYFARCSNDEGPSRVLGSAQWIFLKRSLSAIPPEIKGTILVTGVPLGTTAPGSYGDRYIATIDHDVKAFGAGDLRALLASFQNPRKGSGADHIGNVVEINGISPGSDLTNHRELTDDVRDGWSSEPNLDEAGRLIRLFGSLNLADGTLRPMPVAALGGDIHIGAVQKLTLGNKRTMSLAIGSAIAKENVRFWEASHALASSIVYPGVVERYHHHLRSIAMMGSAPPGQGDSGPGALSPERARGELHELDQRIAKNEQVMGPIRIRIQGDGIRNNNFVVTNVESTLRGNTYRHTVQFSGKPLGFARYAVAVALVSPAGFVQGRLSTL